MQRLGHFSLNTMDLHEKCIAFVCDGQKKTYLHTFIVKQKKPAFCYGSGQKPSALLRPASKRGSSLLVKGSVWNSTFLKLLSIFCPKYKLLFAQFFIRGTKASLFFSLLTTTTSLPVTIWNSVRAQKKHLKAVICNVMLDFPF